MRILHLGKYYPPYPGGIEAYCKNICEGLASKDIKVDVVVSNSENKFTQERMNGVEIYRLPRIGNLSSIPLSPQMVSFLRKLIKKKNYEIVHLHFPNPMGEIAYLLSGFKGKTLITYHADASMRNKLKFLYLPIIRKIFKKADYIIVTSRNYLRNIQTLSKYANKCKVIPIPVNPYFL
ncbi:MAG: glycosyltransferase, partial [Candidatus Thorarchaeota archaeon]